MTIFYSSSTGGFYDTDFIVYNLPSDVIAVTKDQRSSLIAAIADGYSISIMSGTPVIGSLIPSVVPAATKIKPLEFKARFTTSEWGSILITATTDPTVLGWIFEASAATYIDLTDPNTTLGLTYLSTRNPSLLDATRIPVLLSTSS